MTDQANAPAPTRPASWRRIMERVWHDKVVLLAMLYVALMVCAAVASLFLPLDSARTPAIEQRLVAPSLEHPLGTDGLGRDVLARTLVGSRISLLVGVSVVLFAGVFGTAMGVLAGYFGGFWDTVVMRVVDIQLAFPNLLLMVAVIYFFGANVGVLIAALSVVSWMVFARVVRTTVMSVRSSLYVRAAHFAGCSRLSIVRRHLLPAVAPILLTQAMLEFAAIILAESSLSFLGLGVQPPDASWGLMIAENRPYLEVAWWTVFFPGLAIVMTVLAANLIGSAFRVWLDPRQDDGPRARADAAAQNEAPY